MSRHLTLVFFLLVGLFLLLPVLVLGRVRVPVLPVRLLPLSARRWVRVSSVLK